MYGDKNSISKIYKDIRQSEQLRCENIISK